MTILMLETIGLLLLLLIAGFGLLVWTLPRLKLNIILTLGLSMLLGLVIYMALGQVLLFTGLFDHTDELAWILAGFGLLSFLAASYRHREGRLLASLLPKKEHIVVSALVTVFMLPVVLSSVLYPLTAWDAKMIWMVKAKAIYVEPSVPNTLFDSPLFDSSHKDYPLGLPTLVASHYEWYGGVSEQPVAVTYVIFLWSTILVATGMVLQVLGRRGLGAAVVLGIVLSTGNFLYFAGLGLADIPLAAMVTASLAAVWGAVTSNVYRARLVWLGLGGAFALATAMIKNEGVPFIGLYLVTALAVLWLGRSRVRGQRYDLRRAIFNWAILYELMVLPLCMWHVIKDANGYKVDLFIENFSRSGPEYLERAIETVHWFLLEIPSAAHWGWALLPAVLLAGIGMVIWIRARQPREVLLPLVLVAGQLAVYFVIYIVSPHDLTWHVTTSIDRLFIHVVPALYLSVALLWSLLIDKKRVYSTD